MSISNTLKTGRSLFLLQLSSRLITFILNSALLRLSTPEVFGTASIQFDLISATILFLSREGIRNALLRDTKPSKLANVPLFLGFGVASATLGIYLSTASMSTTSQRDFYPALGLYVAAALLELSIEPFYVRVDHLNIRIQAEGLMSLTKAVVTFGVLYLTPRPLLGFGLGQFCGNLVLALRYLSFHGFKDYLWSQAPLGPVSLAIANTRASVIKHALTEADRIAVGRISPLADQGGYAIAMNYGSLIARLAFQPMEETLLLHFSKPHPSHLALLSTMTHLSAHLLLLPAFVPPLLPPILSILLPKRYLVTSAPRTLQTYLSFYLPLLSLNGILEAYHAATACPKDMTRQTRYMITSSFAFVGALYIGKNYVSNETALIGASCVGMIIRIAYAMSFAKLSPLALLPRRTVSLAAVFFGIVLRRVYWTGRWTQSWTQWLELVSLGAVLGIIFLGVTWRAEKDDFYLLRKKLA